MKVVPSAVFDLTPGSLFWIGALTLAVEHRHALTSDELRALVMVADGEPTDDDAPAEVIALARYLWERHIHDVHAGMARSVDRLVADVREGRRTNLSDDDRAVIREALARDAQILPAEGETLLAEAFYAIADLAPARRLARTIEILAGDLAGYAALTSDAACAAALASDDPSPPVWEAEPSARLALADEAWGRRWLDLGEAERAFYADRVEHHAGALVARLDRAGVADLATGEPRSAELPGNRRCLWLDASAIAYLRKLAGTKGPAAELVERMVNAAARRWAEWTNPAPELLPRPEADRRLDLLRLWRVGPEVSVWTKALAHVVWLVDVEPRLNRPVRVSLYPFGSILTLATEADRIEPATNGADGRVLDAGGRTLTRTSLRPDEWVATLEPKTIETLIQNAPAAVRSSAGLKTLIHVIAEAQIQAAVRTSTRVELVYEGLLPEFCQKAGITDRNQWADARAALLFWGHTPIALRGGGFVSSLWWAGYDPTRKVVPEGLKITPHDPVFESVRLDGLKGSKQSDRVLRKLVPIPRKTSEFGRQRDYAKIGMLQLLCLEDMTHRAAELVTDGILWGGDDPDDSWFALARRAGFGVKGARAALSGFQRADDNGLDPFLVSVGGGRFRLNDRGVWRPLAASLTELGTRSARGAIGESPERTPRTKKK